MPTAEILKISLQVFSASNLLIKGEMQANKLKIPAGKAVLLLFRDEEKC